MVDNALADEPIILLNRAIEQLTLRLIDFEERLELLENRRLD